jgi:hypothetical protein
MKYNTTKVAFTHAIVRAMMTFRGPGKSILPATTVSAVPIINAAAMMT